MIPIKDNYKLFSDETLYIHIYYYKTILKVLYQMYQYKLQI